MQTKPEIIVELLPSTGRSHLLPHYDTEANILEVGNAEIHEWPYGIDIDGNIVFDLDKSKTLVNFDLLIPKALWKQSQVIKKPKIDRVGDLRFDESTLQTKSFNMPLTVSCSQNQSSVLIRFGLKHGEGKGIQLSKQCTAILIGNCLVGFFVDINS